jgi:hypothetical protein
VEALGRWNAIPATVNGMAAAPARTNHAPGAVATALALWSVRERDAALPATVPRTDRRQQLSRARLKDITAIRCLSTLEAATVRVQDTP